MLTGLSIRYDIRVKNLTWFAGRGKERTSLWCLSPFFDFFPSALEEADGVAADADPELDEDAAEAPDGRGATGVGTRVGFLVGEDEDIEAELEYRAWMAAPSTADMAASEQKAAKTVNWGLRATMMI